MIMAIEGFQLGQMGHDFTKMAEWNVRGSDVTGEMLGCARCGMVLINDRRGTLLVAPGGLGNMHKRIFPCQRPPKCIASGVDPSPLLREIHSQLTEKGDPRFRILR